ncbi:MAG: tetratricopeptide repeat protein [Myxococcota bacterium]
MDVTCERCGTEYEFDETLVSDRGTTVKCTNCGHLFKVYRPGAGPGGTSSRTWAIRKRGGGTQTLTSLRELQRLITQGELTEDDEISRSGEAWKPLGAIAELQTFFAAARAGATPARKDGTQPFSTSSPPPRRDARAYAPTVEHGFGDNSPTLPSNRPAEVASAEKAALQADATRVSSASAHLAAEEQLTSPGPEPRASKKRTVMGLGQPVPEPYTESAPTVPGQSPSFDAPTEDEITRDTEPNDPQYAKPALRSPKGTVMGIGSSVPPPASPIGSVPPAAPVPIQPSRGPFASAPASTPAPSPPVADAGSATASATSDAKPFGREIAPTRSSSEPLPPPREPVNTAPIPAGQTEREAEAAMAARAQREAKVQQAEGKRPLYIEEEPERPTQARGGRGVILAAVAIVFLGLVGGGIALSWGSLGPMLGFEEEDPIAELLEAGDRQVRRAHIDAYQAALEEYGKAEELAENRSDVLASLARAHAALAQAYAFDANDLRKRAEAEPGLAEEAAVADRNANHHGNEALRFAQSAVESDPADAPAVVALADALRLTGNVDSAEEQLQRARTLVPDGSAELSYVQGLVAAARAGDTDVDAAIEDARRAVAMDSSHLRARLLLAVAFLQRGDVGAARSEIDAVLASEGGHPRAQYLRNAIDRGLPPAPAVFEALDGATPDADAATPEPTEETTEVEEAPVAESDRDRDRDEPPDERREETIPEGRNVDWYVRQAYRAQENRNPGSAQRYYRAALSVSPGNIEANTGLGAILLDMGRPRDAIPHLEPGARAAYSDAAILLARAHRRIGQNAQARAAYQGYLDRRPNGAYANAARNGLRDLGVSGESPNSPDTPPSETADPLEDTPSQPTNPGAIDPGETDPAETDPSSDAPPGPNNAPTPSEPAPAPNELPAPIGTDPANPPPPSDPPGTEP